jgi:hypothetical protein
MENNEGIIYMHEATQDMWQRWAKTSWATHLTEAKFQMWNICPHLYM